MEIRQKTYNLYTDLLACNHILIAGSAGSGKSTLIDGLMHSAMFLKTAPTFYLIDPKRVDLRKYRNVRLVARRVTEAEDAIAVLNDVLEVIEDRYKEMEKQDRVLTIRNDIYVVIDEVADLILTHGKEVTPLIQRIAQIGRAAKVHLIMATQTVLASILSTPIKNNFDCIVGLRTATANQSRVIIGINGCEKLPRFGQGIVSLPAEIKRYKLPQIPAEDLQEVINYWRR
jgi:S-DNA-T family DNA segregation ATPase FtsK/SpoIIIE